MEGLLHFCKNLKRKVTGNRKENASGSLFGSGGLFVKLKFVISVALIILSPVLVATYFWTGFFHHTILFEFVKEGF